jgi:transposase-like protein
MPMTYSDEERATIVSHVLAELSGGRAVSRILREDDGMPDQATFWRWHLDDEDLRGKVAQARANGVESVMDEALAIADVQEMGETITEEPIMVDGKPLEGVTARKVKTEDMLGHRKLRVETRFKYAQMIAPRKYGPRTLLGSDPDNPLPAGFDVRLLKTNGPEAG